MKGRPGKQNDTERVAGVLPPRQSRGRETLARLLDEAETALEERRFDELTIAQLAARTGVAVGNFYRRFRNKEALLEALYRRYEARRTRAFEREFATERWVGQDLASRCDGISCFLVRFSRTHRGLLRSFAMHYRARPDRMRGAFEERLRGLYGLAASVLLERRNEITHPDPELAVQLGLLIVAATCRNKIVFGDDPHPRSVSVSDDRLGRELGRALLAYLRAADGGAGSAPTTTRRRRPPRRRRPA